MHTQGLTRIALLLGCLVAGPVGCLRRPAAVTLDDSAAPTVSATTSRGSSSPDDLVEDGDNPREGFRFPEDGGGKLLADLLPPSENLPRLPSDFPSGPRRFPAPRALEQPELPLPPNQAALPRALFGVASRPAQPRSLPEDSPLSGFRGDPVLPQRPQFPAGERVHVPSPDLNQPIPLPILARKQREPAQLDDPTSAVSMTAALAASLPRRTVPAPFLRLSLPDPFEHRHAVRLRAEPAEDHNPPTSSPRLPGR